MRLARGLWGRTQPAGVTPHVLQRYRVMGSLEDAIREHLALKREQGTSEEELERKEAEAFRAGGPPAEVPPTEASLEDAESAPPESSDAVVAEPAREVEPQELPAAPEAPAPPEAPSAEPEPAAKPEPAVSEALEPDAPVPGEIPAPQPAPEPAPKPVDEWFEDEQPKDDTSEDQDPLEEIPEFLEDTPEQERLWFEQKAPKEFDFGD